MKTFSSVCSRWKVISRKWRMRWTSLRQTCIPLHHFLNRYRALYRYGFEWWLCVLLNIADIVGKWSAVPLFIVVSISTVYCGKQFHCLLWSVFPLFIVVSIPTVYCGQHFHCLLWSAFPLFIVVSISTVYCGQHSHCLFRKPQVCVTPGGRLPSSSSPPPLPLPPLLCLLLLPFSCSSFFSSSSFFYCGPVGTLPIALQPSRPFVLLTPFLSVPPFICRGAPRQTAWETYVTKGGSMGENWLVKFSQTIRLPRNCWVL
jgi:hypothetical protein